MELKYEFHVQLWRDGEFIGNSGWYFTEAECNAWKEGKKMLTPGGCWFEMWDEKPRF